jgi:WD40 repeat protein
MPPVKRLVSLSIAIGLAGFTVVGSRAISQQAVLAQDAILPQQRQLIAQRQSRIALVIGNAAYDEGALANPVNDATDIAAAFEELGFEVTLLQNQNKREMDEAIEAFSRKLRRGSVGVFYYAGHGIQVDGENYLIPIKAKLQNEKDARYDAVPLGKALNAMEASGNLWNVVIIDACRDNPFYRRWYRSMNTRGLTAVTPPNGTIIAYSTKAGTVAEDGTGQRNSPFTSALLRKLKTVNLDVRLLFGEVTALVAQKTSRKQVPWTESNLIGIGGKFYLNPKPDKRTVRSPQALISSIRTLKGHTNTILQVAVSPDGQHIISGGYDNSIKIWNLETGKLERSIEYDSNIEFDPNIGFIDKTGNGKKIDPISVIHSLVISPDGQRIISGGWDGNFKTWNLETGKLENVIKSHSKWISSLAISPDGQRIVSGGVEDKNNSIEVWNLAMGKLEHKLEGHSRSAFRFSISPDGRYIISGSFDKSIKIWNLDTGKLERTLVGHSGGIYSLAISSSGQYIVSGSGNQTTHMFGGSGDYDNTIKIWNLETGKLERTLVGHSDVVWSVAISPNEKYIVSGSADKSIKIWNLETGKLERTLVGDSKGVQSVAISPDGQYIVSGGQDNDIRLWWLE